MKMGFIIYLIKISNGRKSTYNYVYLLPLFASILMPIGFIATYLMSVLQGHVEPDFPYISDTGTFPPESCVFGQVLSVETILILAFAYARYREVEYFYDRDSSKYLCVANYFGVWFGVISSAGMSLVGNFQETNVIIVHMIGAAGCFGFGILYFWTQTYISYKLCPIVNTRLMAHMRMLLSLMCTVLLPVCAISMLISMLQFDGDNRQNWQPEDSGYELHIIGTATEWLMGILFCLYLLSFTKEFKRLSFEKPALYIPDLDGRV